MGGMALGGAMISANASKEAASTQSAAAQRGIDAQMLAREEAMGRLDPFITTGTNALTSLASLYGISSTPGGAPGTPFSGNSLEAFRNSPDYAFARDEGTRALALNKSASGMLHSGNYLRDLTTFGQGLATQNFNNYAGRLMSMGQLGANAAGMGAQTLMQSGNSLANLNLAQGQANASGIVGEANAISGGMNSFANNLMLMNMMNRGGSAYGGSNVGYGTGANGWTGNTGYSGWIQPGNTNMQPNNSLSYYGGPGATYAY
jgi:hypothetical protein